jgi:hypothetical protein
MWNSPYLIRWRWLIIKILAMLNCQNVYYVGYLPYTPGMANPRLTLESLRPARIIKHLQNKLIFVPIKYSGMPTQREIRIIN